MKEQIQLSDSFDYRKLFRFTLPSVVMMLFSSIYSIVDGLFVANFAGKVPFAAVNFIMPFLVILSSGGFMLGIGATALISKTLGEGDKERANQIFSMTVWTTVMLGAVISVVGSLIIRKAAAWLGAEGEMLEQCVKYARITIPGAIAFALQIEFQSLLPAAEKPKLGLVFTVAAGLTNIVLDALFVGLFRWGIQGAAGATLISMSIAGFGPLIYFMLPNTSLLRVGKPWFNKKAMLKICTNGSSELMSNISMSVVGMLYNIQLLKYAGENGVAAYGVLMYVNFIFLAIFIGYSMGVAPVIGFHYGAKNQKELQSLLNKSGKIILCTSLIMTLLSLALTVPFSKLFTRYDEALYQMTVRGFFIYSFSYLFSGVAIFGSSFFTALNNGPVSALISFLRTLVFQTAAVMLLPLLFGMDGIWYSCIVAELFATLITAVCLLANNRKYGYFSKNAH